MQRQEEERRRQEERRIFEKWLVQAKYLQWTPMEVDLIDDIDFLRFLHGKYKWPASQPQNWQEETYLEIMAQAIADRLRSLNSAIFNYGFV